MVAQRAGKLRELFFTGNRSRGATTFFLTDAVELLCGAPADVFVEDFFVRLAGVCACMGMPRQSQAVSQ